MEGFLGARGIMVIIWICCLLHFALGELRTNATSNEIAQISAHLTDILQTYDKRIRPDAEGPPIEIVAEFKVGSLGGISEAEMSYSMDIFFRHWWTDPRLKSNFSKPITLSIDASSIIWIPDTYFVNSKYSSFHKVIGDCMRLIIWPNGTIYYSVRVDLELRCDMDLRLYPFDTQHCPFIVESHAYTKDDIIYKWNMRRTNGVEVASNQTAQFVLKEAILHNSTSKKIAGTYSTLFATFLFKRRLEFFVITVFAPAIILTVMSWCSLWISAEAIPARITLCITTILSMILLTGSANSHMPKVSYLKAMDTFLLGSLSFIFMSLVEFVVVLNTSPSQTSKSNKTPTPDTYGNLSAIDDQDTKVKFEPDDKDNQKNTISMNGSNDLLPSISRSHVMPPPSPRFHGVHYVDTASRVLFPVLYLFFIGSLIAWYSS